MKKSVLVLLVVMFVGIGAVAGNAAYLNDWRLNPTGVGGFGAAEVIGEYLDLTGQAAIVNDFDTFTFTETGSFTSFSHDAINAFDDPLTATFTASGTLTLDAFFFDPSAGALTIYAPDSTQIGVFDLVGGQGALVDYAPNGVITAMFVAQSLTEGYWFDPSGNDMSAWTLGEGSPILVIGLATTNASILQVPAPTLDELGRLETFTVSNNGQFRLSVVPEPSTMLLFGTGLIALAAFGRKKLFKQ